MPVSTQARTYAKALLEKALEEGRLSDYQADLRKLGYLLDEKGVVERLQDAGTSWEERSRYIVERLGELSPEILNLAGLLATRGEVRLLPEISDEYQRLADGERGFSGVSIAEVTTAIPLSQEMQDNLARRLAQRIGKPVVIKNRVDPDIIGGSIIKIGDHMIDGSIRSRLEALRREVAR